MRMRILKKDNICIIIMLALLTGFGFLVNRGIEIKALYMDDLYMWSCYGEQGILEFVFPIGTSTRFRPVYWLAVYLQMALVGPHVSMFAAFNIAVNVLVAWELFFMAGGLTRGMRASGAGKVLSSLTAFMVGIAYLASRFAYYQIGQVLGLMETMALAMAVAVLYLLLKYCLPGAGDGPGNRPGGNGAGEAALERSLNTRRSFYLALIIWFLLAFVHERYLGLFPLFYLSLTAKLLCKGTKDRSAAEGADGSIHAAEFFAPAITLIVITIIRTLTIGSAMPAGTGGTYVTETFSIGEAIGFGIDQVLYIFGVNAGPEYLCGIEWGQTPAYIKRIIKCSVLFIGIVCIIFSIIFIKKLINCVKIKKQTSYQELTGTIGTCIMFGAFIALCIGCSSVTIRLEMRWIYVSYAAALLFASYMIGVIYSGGTAWGVVSGAVFAAYIFLSVYANIFCRGYFYKIYFWQNQLRMNSLAEETIEKYGTDGVFGRNIYILENSYGMSDFYAATFFKPFDPGKKAEGTSIIFADSLEAVPEDEIISGRALVIIEVPEEDAYRDVTGELIS